MNRHPARERNRAWSLFVKRNARHNDTLPQHAHVEPHRESFNAGYKAGRRSKKQTDRQAE